MQGHKGDMLTKILDVNLTELSSTGFLLIRPLEKILPARNFRKC